MSGDGPPGPGPRVGCVLVAAGSGTRLGQGVPKALVRVGGRTLLEHAVEAVAAASHGATTGAPCIEALVVVVPVERITEAGHLVLSTWQQAHPSPTAATAPAAPPTASAAAIPVVVAGGADRQESVALGLAALPADTDVVLVHDAARAFAPPTLLHRVAAAVTGDVVAVVPGLPVTDTIKLLAAPTPGRTARAVERTLDRAGLVAVQTPQGFRADALRAVHAAASAARAERTTPAAGDDAGMVEDAGHAVLVVAGDADAWKVTTPLDLDLAEALLARRQAAAGGDRDGHDATGPGVIRP